MNNPKKVTYRQWGSYPLKLEKGDKIVCKTRPSLSPIAFYVSECEIQRSTEDGNLTILFDDSLNNVIIKNLESAQINLNPNDEQQIIELQQDAKATLLGDIKTTLEITPLEESELVTEAKDIIMW